MDDAVRLGVDVGGAFTDVVLVADGAVTTAKVPTTPDGQSDGVLRGVERPDDEAAVRDLADRIPDSVRAVAVCLLYAYGHPENERQVASVLREEGEAVVVTSHEVLAAFREYERSATTGDDTVTPVIRDYLDRLTRRAEQSGLPAPRVMQSNGGITDATTLRDHAATTTPRGLAGGEDSAPGRNLVDGESVGAKVTRDLDAGSLVRLETSGGGGHGTPEADTGDGDHSLEGDR